MTAMKTYRIRLRNMEDFKKYAALFDIWKFSAIISGNNFCVDASDIITLFCHWPYEYLLFTINDIYQGRLNDIESYLTQSGLLASAIY